MSSIIPWKVLKKFLNFVLSLAEEPYTVYTITLNCVSYLTPTQLGCKFPNLFHFLDMLQNCSHNC